MTKRRMMNEVHPSKMADHNFNNNMNDNMRPGKTTRERSRGCTRMLSNFAEKTSLNGVPFINASTSSTVKFVWTLLLAAAIGAMVYHLYSLFSNFFAYTKHSQVGLSFSNLPFPAVTICNINIMRMSMKKKASKDIRDLIDSLNPEKQMQKAMTWKPEYSNSSSGESFRNGNFMDDISLNSNLSYTRSKAQDTFFQKSCSSCWEAQSESSSSSQDLEQFKDLFSAQNETTRDLLGHQIQDMLLQCSFAGRKCYQANFTRVRTGNYGSCYTLQNSKFITRRSGPDGGLELILFLETDEYVPGITNGKGFQIAIHEQGSIPFPADEGIAITAGAQTVIGLRMLQITRLGMPYGPCKSTATFESINNVTYSRNTCQRLCEQKLIRSTCDCYDLSRLELNDVMQNPLDLPPCANDTQLTCIYEVQYNFDATDSSCGCDSPCSEKMYEKTVAARQWPSPTYASILVESICKDRSADVCNKLKNKTKEDRLADFIKLNIYYEDLNYEELSEQADYEKSQLLSDIGGSIGLWIGLSVLGLFELFHLVADIVIYMCWGECQEKGAKNLKHGDY